MSGAAFYCVLKAILIAALLFLCLALLKYDRLP